MEDLNKTQIILLTLLVSFVTSIATGIVTVSLLDQAPPSVTQTINRVVQTTVEKVIPGEKTTTVVTKEVPVNDEDMITSAVSQNAKSLVRIKESNTITDSYGKLGLVVSKDGLIMVPAVAYDPNAKYEGLFSDGKSYPLTAVQTSAKDISLFKTAGDNVKDKYVFTPANLSDSDALKLGQTVISLGGLSDRNLVGVGVISGIKQSPAPESSKDSKPASSLIETNLNSGDGASGFYLLNLAGEVIGIHLGSEDSLLKSSYTPINLIKDQISPPKAA